MIVVVVDVVVVSADGTTTTANSGGSISGIVVVQYSSVRSRRGYFYTGERVGSTPICFVVELC